MRHGQTSNREEKEDRGRANYDGNQRAEHGAGRIQLLLPHRGRVGWKDSFRLKGECFFEGWKGQNHLKAVLELRAQVREDTTLKAGHMGTFCLMVAVTTATASSLADRVYLFFK